MILLLASILLAVELGGGFGAATASVVSTGEESLIVEFHVEVQGEAEAVLVHLVLPGEDPVTLPMLPRDDGVYGLSTELRRADYLVVFEAIGEVGFRSQPVSLTDLGAEMSPPAGAGSPPGEEGSATAWMWLALAFAAASLSALAFWALGDGAARPRDHAEASAEPVGAP